MLYDERASSGDTDDAQVLFTTDNLNAAREARRNFPGSIIFSYIEEDGFLTWERREK